MFRTIFCLISIVFLGVALSLKAAQTPTPTPTPKKSFLSALKPRVNPSATVARTGAAVGRGSHLGVDRSAQSPTPKPTTTPKSKSSPSNARKSPTAIPAKAAKSPTPSSTETPRSVSSPQKEISPGEESPPTSSPQGETVSPSQPPMPSPSQTTTPTPTSTATPTVTPTPTASVSPVARPTKIQLTLTKFEPPHGSPGDRSYRSAQLSYRISVPNRMEYPTIEFTVETTSGRLFERVSRLPSGYAFVEPDDNTEHTVALDPVDRDDWADAYAKTDRATFIWSIEGQSSGRVEKSVKKPWP
jgi:hypothetical protein